MSQAHKLSLSVQYASLASGLPARQQFRRWLKAALQQDLQCTLRIVDEAEGRQLNHDFRGKDYATNVLTFVYDDTEPLWGISLFARRWWNVKRPSKASQFWRTTPI